MQTKADAKSKLTIVLLLIPSPKNILVNAVNEIITIAKPTNLPGQSNPSNAINEYLVAVINK